MEQSDEMLQLGSASLFCVRYPEHGYTREVEALATRVSA
jgi:hypothetical protein